MAIPIDASSTPNSFTANDGSIGIKIPKPNKSINTVININVKADLFFNIFSFNFSVLMLKYTDG